MKFSISNPAELGALIRANRKATGLRQDDAAGCMGVSENFLGKVERGAENVQWGKLFAVIEGLGMKITVEVPELLEESTRALLDAHNAYARMEQMCSEDGRCESRLEDDLR